ncbi:putative secreted protein (Por secretion system target) [Larkinella arboricola]|uniref:Putative secreted protein (Por secretion system target) n=1 Tax=Larkinella arboricola TaxID=643671 RepID=A0A327X4I3_LARAB|nr:T9SS type A sorting domain-containing protein [Larkinella arboricola]RAJ99982.1 putative secreted protein (Por secretion system target) [Larkinella arboricola]
MKKLYRVLIACFLLVQSLYSYSQNLTLSYPPNSICTATPVSLTLTTNATFEATNKLSLQIRNNYSDQYTSLPFTQSGNVLTFQVPASLIQGNNRWLAFRVISTAPALESEWVGSAEIIVPAEVRLTGVTPAVSNRTEPFWLKYEATGTGPVTATLSDSSRVALSYYGGENNGTIPFYASTSGTVRLVSVQNGCGMGKASGEVTLTVNPVSLRTVSATPAVICRGGILTVSYSRTHGTFGASNRFKIRLTEYSRYSDQPTNPVVHTLDAKEENGLLQAVIPETLSNGANGNAFFSVAVVTTDPVTVGYSNQVYVELRPRATAELTTPSTTIEYGEWVNLNVKFQGQEPFYATLNNGTMAYTPTSSGYSTNVYPKKSTTYRIERFESGCSSSEIPPTSTAVHVKPGIAIDSIPGILKPFCEGETVRIKFSTNAELSSNTQFSVILTGMNNAWTSNPIPVRRESDDYLTFEIPAMEPGTSSESRYYSVTLQTTVPSLRSLPNSRWNLQVNSKPTFARFNDYSRNLMLEEPGVVSLYMETNGGGPYRIISNDGVRDYTTELGWPNVTATVFTNTTFTVRSVANTCGTLENPGAMATVTVKKSTPAQIYLRPMTEYHCETDSITVTFETTGEFLPGNEFRVQASNNSLGYGYWTNGDAVGSGTQSPIRIKVPSSSKIRIISTNPVVVSNEEDALTGYRLRANIQRSYYSPYTMAESKAVLPRSILPGETVTLPIEVNSPAWTGPYSLTYTDGTRNYTYEGSEWPASQRGLKPLQTTTYRLVGISNVCGLGTIDGEATFTVVPFRISMPVPVLQYENGQNYSYAVCEAGSLNIPFLTDVTPPAGTIFALQLASQKDSVYSDLVTGTGSPLVAQFPTSLEAGFYWLRIVAKGTEARTEPVVVKVQQLPSAILRSPANGASIINPGETFRPTVSLTGTAPWNVLFSDNTVGQYYYSLYTLALTPTRATTYSIRAVTNACGYGQVSGEASVRVQPMLFIERVNPQYRSDACAGETITVSYRALGDFDAGTKLTIQLRDNQGKLIRDLGQPTGLIGQLRFSLPTDLSAGSYQINLQASTTSLLASSPVQLSIKTPPRVTLTGSTTINAGQSVYLSLRNEANNDVYQGEQVTYQLSDGTSGRVLMVGSQPTSLAVNPTQTTTYTIKTVSGVCGAGQARGSATVTVNPKQERSVNTADAAKWQFCTGEQVSVPYTTSGTFSATNQFQVQLLDSTGHLVSTLPSSSTVSPLQVTLPDDLPAGGGYRWRVTASDANTSSGAGPNPFQIYQRVRAAFDSASVVRQPGQPVSLTLRFEGPGPWYYTISGNPGTFYGAATSNPLLIIPPIESNLYTLISVGNALCGNGVVGTPSSVKVELLTAVDPALRVSVGPNPTRDQVHINLPSAPRFMTLQVTDLSGRTLLAKQVKTAPTWLSLASLPAGTYLLSVEVNQQRSTYRLIRN